MIRWHNTHKGMLSALEGIPLLMPSRILVTGSRDWADRRSVAIALHTTLVALELRDSPEQAILVHGAARGLDSIAAEIADRWGMQTEAHPARWDLHGKSAGPRRNSEMVKSGVDVCLGFPIGPSPGTRGCMAAARRAGIRVVDVSRILP